MAVSTTATQLKDMALSLLGADDYAASTSRAAQIDRYYDLAIRQEERLFPWPELITRAELTGTAHPDTQDMAGYYEFTFPADCLRVIEASSDFTTEKNAAANPANILATVEDLEIRYVKLETDVTKFSDELELCIAYNMAAKAAAGITKNPKIALHFEQMLRQQIRPEQHRSAEYGRGQDTSIPRTRLHGHLGARWYDTHDRRRIHF